jgi:hypothetical protein
MFLFLTGPSTSIVYRRVEMKLHAFLISILEYCKPITTRLQGRPKSRWDDNIKKDICKMKIKNWAVCVQDRGKWRDVVEKAETFNI